MTASELLAIISLSLLVQLAFGVAAAAIRYRKGISAGSGRRTVSAPTIGIGAWNGLRTFRVAARTLEDSAGSQCSFYLEPVDAMPLPSFKPGQFLTFGIHVESTQSAGTRTLTRFYSLSGSPQERQYRVTIKRVAAPENIPNCAPGASSNYFHDTVQVGSLLQVRAPSGHFFLDTQSDTPVVLVGGGIGITPMMSMLQWCLANQPTRQVHLFYGLRNSAEHAFKSVLEDAASQSPAFHLHVAYSQPEQADVAGKDYHHAGRVDIELLRTTLPHGRHQFYICGPSAMMESLVPALAQWGIASEDIHFEAFGPASVRLPAVGQTHGPVPISAPVEIRFQRSARSVVWDGSHANLLVFAEQHGIHVDSGCRSGKCGSCATGVRSGTVVYDSPPDFDLAAGQCLLCVGRPVGALVLEA